MNNYKLAIKKFYKIRDLPYHIATKGEQGYDCEDKSKMLVKELQNFYINARLRIGLFNWSVLDLPKTVTDIKHDEHCSHCFAEIENKNGDWIFVDSTWNKELKKAGFKIAEWDGVNPTCLAFECNKILSPEDSIEYMRNINYETDLVKNSEFYEAINRYCDSFLNKN